MLVFKRRRDAAVAVLSALALIALGAEAAAKSKHVPTSSRAASVSRAVQGAGAGSYVAGAGGYASGAGMGGAYIPPPRRGVVNDNTAGWGNVGAF